MRLEVRYRGDPVGLLDDGTGHLLFQYESEWLEKGIELSPFYLPLQRGVISLKGPFEGGLSGLFADSLPDYWGRTIMDRRLREAGVNPGAVSVLKRLALVGEGGFGALTYHPADSEEGYEIKSLEEAVLFSREVLEWNSKALPGSTILQQAGSNPGGRYPKLCVGWNSGSGDLVVGTQNYPEGFQPCLLKLDVDIERSEAERGLCRREFTLIESAKRCGIRVSEHRLLCSSEPDGSRREHLLVSRFDRRDGRRIHLHSFSGIAHKLPIKYGNSYEELIRTVNGLTRDQREVEEMFRRTVFNVLCGNRDDHVRNHAFLMQEPDAWQLSPAYDLTPTPHLEEHCLSVNGKWSRIGVDDLVALGKAFSVKGMDEILERIRSEAERLRCTDGFEESSTF